MLSLVDLLYSAVIVTVSVAVAAVISAVVKKYAVAYAARTKTAIDDIVIRVVRVPLYLLIILVGVNLALRWLGIFEVISTT